jgi:hypothetical protein
MGDGSPVDEAERAPAALAELIQSLKGGLEMGEDPRHLAERLWPNALHVVAVAKNDIDDRVHAGIMKFLDETARLKAGSTGREGAERS